jgi:hypothetical protein
MKCWYEYGQECIQKGICTNCPIWDKWHEECERLWREEYSKKLKKEAE